MLRPLPLRRTALAALVSLSLAPSLGAQSAPSSSADPTRWFVLGSRGGAPARFDGNAIVIGNGPPSAFWTGGGPHLPSKARIEMTVSQQGCAANAASSVGIAFANNGRDQPFVLELKGSGTGLITEMGSVGLTVSNWPGYAPGVKRKLVLEINGRTVMAYADGKVLGMSDFERELTGAMGVVSGGEGCETRYEDIRIHYLAPQPTAVTAPAATRDAIAMLDTTNMTRNTSGVTQGGGIAFDSPRSTLLRSRRESGLRGPFRLEATMQSTSCTDPAAAVVGLAFGQSLDAGLAVVEVRDGQWAVRTLGGLGAAGTLPAGLFKVGDPVRIAVLANETVATIEINGRTVGSVELGRGVDGGFGVIRGGCPTLLSALKFFSN